MEKISLEIVIPIYNEGDKVIKLLHRFQNIIKTQIRVFLCYDTEKDSPRFFRNSHRKPRNRPHTFCRRRKHHHAFRRCLRRTSSRTWRKFKI